MGIIGKRKTGDFLLLANGFVLLVLVNLLSEFSFFRIDLTEEKRFTIKEETSRLLRGLDDDVYVEVFLAGDLNATFTRFQKSIRETLREFEVYSDRKVHFTFTDPLAAASQQARSEFLVALSERGLSAQRIVESENGATSERIVVPGAIVSYGGRETGVMFPAMRSAQDAISAEEAINQAIENVEFALTNAIYKLTNTNRARIGWVVGHGELDSLEIAVVNNTLLDRYDLYRLDLSRREIPAEYNMVIVARPTSEFTLEEQYKLDQYIMRGGKVLFMIDPINAVMDSASRDDYFAMPYDMNLDNMLFRYGVRVNKDLVQDLNAASTPVITGQMGGRPQLLPWPFYPLVTTYSDHPITRNLRASVIRFGSSIDTVKADGVKKTPLLFSSSNSRTVSAPAKIGINDLRKFAEVDWTKTNIPMGYLLEGTFTSLFKNRFLPEGADRSTFREESIPTSIIVFSDGDLVRNQVNPQTGQPLDLGDMYANLDLMLNSVSYLAGEEELIRIRDKEIILRPLNREKVAAERTKWQLINILIPVSLVIVYGVGHAFWRRKKYSHR